MDRSDLRSFTDRVRALEDAPPPTSAAETRSWLVDPLVDLLGWDVHAPDCRADVTVADARLAYVLAAAATPAVFVAVEPYADALESDRVRRLQTAMAQTGVDRTIYTNGQDLVLLAGVDGSDRFECPFESLHEHHDALAHFSRATAERRLERHSRRYAARRLAVDRTELASTIADDLASVAGEHYRPEFRRAGRAFVDSLVERLVDAAEPAEPRREAAGERTLAFTDSTAAGRSDDALADGRHGSTGESDATPEPSTAGQGSADEHEGGVDAASDPSVDEAASVDAEGEAGDVDDGSAGDGEYVVRFFREHGSIGAIGHSSPEDATAAAAEFLFERGLSGVRTPWGPDDGTVLNDEPTLADGSPMPAFRELSNGLYLNTAGDVDDLAGRVVAMVERAGLRAMLTGDWSDRTA